MIPIGLRALYLVSKEFAKIPELEVAEVMGLKSLRACITGPVELYLSAFGSTTYTDILFLLAESVARFAENALASGKVKVVSLDEPSLGISPSVAFSEDDILRALEIASKPCHDTLCEVHLHSALYAEPCCRVEGINVVGIESAANPDYLKLVDRKVLEETDTYLRAGHCQDRHTLHGSQAQRPLGDKPLGRSFQARKGDLRAGIARGHKRSADQGLGDLWRKAESCRA